MRTPLSILLGVGLLIWGCGKLPEPTTPDPVEDPGPVAPTPAPPVSGPAPDPTPTPVLGSPSSNPSPEPSDDESSNEDPSPDPTPDTTSPPDTSGCGAPTPPAISRVNVKVHLRGPNAWTLDATPLVGPDADYCASIGFTDGRSMCPVRPEGHPERVACETWAVGTAVDTGRPGPTWRHDGSLCTGVNCENHPDNQYFVRAFANGSYQACASNGACGSVDVNR